MSTSVEDLLDRLGEPPKEVCLDWACQLLDLLRSTSDSASSGSEDVELFAWRDLMVDRDGLISGVAGGTPNIEGLESKINELISWAAKNGLSNSDDRLIVQIRNNLENSRSQLDGRERLERLSPSATHTAANIDSLKPDALEPARKKRTPALLYPIAGIVALLGLAVLVFVLGDSLFDFSATESSGIANAPNPNADESLVETPNQAAQEEHIEVFGEINSNASVDELFEANTANDLSIDIELNGLAVAPNLSQPNETMELDGAKAAATEPATEAQPASAYNLADSAPADRVAELKALERDNTTVQDALKGITDDLASAAEEKTLSIAEATEKQHDPLAIPVFPIRQTYKLPPKLRIRTRSPAWKIRLEVADGFVVEPDAPVVVAAREGWRWRIFPEERQDKLFVELGLQIPNQKAERLQFQIAAGHVEYPWLVLPLRTQNLDAIQANLSALETRAIGASEYLKGLSSSGISMSRAERSLLSSLRKGYEEQAKLSQKILAVVAETNLLVGLMDGQIELHAQIVDARAPDSPALLQLGDFLDADKAHVNEAEQAK